MSASSRHRKPSRWQLLRRRRRDTDYIWQYQFPEHVETQCRRNHPDLADREWKLIDQGLREWFLCCAWRDGEAHGMPSRLVDEAWHAFILDSLAYTEFCDRAFGEYLHHTPEASMATPMPEALDATSHGGDGDGHHHHGSGGEGGSFEGGEAGGGADSGSGDDGSGGGDSGGGGGDSGGGDSGGGGGE